MLLRLPLLFILFLLLAGVQTSAQQDEIIITPRERSLIYAGPGVTYLPENRLAWQDELTPLERNQAGTWLFAHIRRGQQTELEGWVRTGHLTFASGFDVYALPVSEMPDADPSTVNSRSMQRLFAIPLLSGTSDNLRAVFELGQQLGNDPAVITKVGDSVSASPVYIGALAEPDAELGPYAELAPIVSFYAESAALPSVASRIGLSTYGVFDPLWTDPAQCEPNETPLSCEYRLKKPAIAFVLFGPNDVRSMDETQYEAQIRLIIEQSLASGVIPILNTFSVHPEDELWFQSLNFNFVLTQLAQEYELPLINFWAAARELPDYGLDEDGVHLLHSGFTHLIYTTGHEAYYGVSLLNLLSLRMLADLHDLLIGA